MKDVWNEIMRANQINLYTHKGCDGDSLGSCVALSRLLCELGKDAQTITLDGLDGKLAECSLAAEVRTIDREADLYAYPDTPGSFLVTALRKPNVVIDHHSM